MSEVHQRGVRAEPGLLHGHQLGRGGAKNGQPGHVGRSRHRGTDDRRVAVGFGSAHKGQAPGIRLLQNRTSRILSQL